MSSERGLEQIRAVREQISCEHGNNPRALIDHYMEYQKRFADRLRRAPDATSVVEQQHSADAASSRR